MSTGAMPMTDIPDLRQMRHAADLVLYSSTATKSDVVKKFIRLTPSQALLEKLR